MEGLLYGAVLRSPHAHARIRSIDASKALALPGVKAVITAADLPKIHDGIMDMGETSADAKWLQDNVLASDKALYHGHAVAALAATDPHIADDALGLIEVDYEVLTPVTDVREAMLDDAPILHTDLRTSVRAAGADTPTDRETNIAVHMRLERGDVNAAFDSADIVIEREFETSWFHQGYIEPHSATAFWNRDGKLTIWNSSQGPFVVRDAVAKLLAVPIADITLVPLEIGGGFGGKIPIYLEPLAALLSKKTGDPVRITMTREAVFLATGPTSATYNRIKLGAMRDGTIVAAEAYLAYAAGAYPGSPVGAGVQCTFGPYYIENQKIDGYDVVTNGPKSAAYRAPGAPASEFAAEATINELADRLEMDPVDLRLKNAIKEGNPSAAGVPMPRIGASEVMDAVKNHPHYTSELQGEDVGRGVGFGFWFNAGLESGSTATINSDGSVSLIVGSVDIGGTRASLAMQLAETMGLPYERIKPHVADTDSVPFTHVTGGSRTTFAGGWVAYELGLSLKEKMRERAAQIWQVDLEDVEFSADAVISAPPDAESNDREFTFAELAAKMGSTGGQISSTISLNKNSQGAAYGGHIVDVHVDRDTGKVEILRYTAIQDVGTAIHPAYVEGQIQGGAVQGIGMALTEEYFYDDDGHLRNASFLDYRMPTTLDIPMIDVEIVEVPNPGHPYGVRGVGEVPIVPPMPTIQQAIYDAIGIRFYQAPMSPRVILEELLNESGVD
ncbi:MAG: xanthine dehydrogenase family protein molybdopterin-binding subunit [Chloroflexi bacterium]|nr:xanthine dehydrogenase family protein molybdopterin-binding subunit [Chloroflexota bacterium]